MLGVILRRLNVIAAFRELGTDKQRRETMIALASTQLLVQLSSMPIALTIPSVARHFDVDVAQAAWLVNDSAPSWMCNPERIKVPRVTTIRAAPM